MVWQNGKPAGRSRLATRILTYLATCLAFFAGISALDHWRDGRAASLQASVLPPGERLQQLFPDLGEELQLTSAQVQALLDLHDRMTSKKIEVNGPRGTYRILILRRPDLEEQYDEVLGPKAARFKAYIETVSSRRRIARVQRNLEAAGLPVLRDDQARSLLHELVSEDRIVRRQQHEQWERARTDGFRLSEIENLEGNLRRLKESRERLLARVGDILSAEQVRELDVLLWADLESVRRALDDGL